MSKLIRISQSSYDKLSDLEEALGKTKQQVIEKALKELEREQFFKRVNEEYIKNPELLKEEKVLMEEWDVTLLDGLDDESFE